METPVNTTALPEGVTLEMLLNVYNKNRKSLDTRNAWFKTEEGKAYNRANAKNYYDKNKEIVLQKMATRYEKYGEAINQKNKEYYEKNKEKILEKRKLAKEAKNAEA